MAKLQLTTDEAQAILRALSYYQLNGPNPMDQEQYAQLAAYIDEEEEKMIPTVMGLPPKEDLSDDGIEFLDKWRNPYIAYYIEGEELPYSIFESLGEDAGSDDDPEFECETYEELQQWMKELEDTGVMPNNN